jgi:predicted site-specific integrase-resolvase
MRHPTAPLGPELETHRLVTLATFASLLSVEPRTLHRWIDAGRVPPPIRDLAPRKLYWRQETVVKFIQELEARS